MKLSKINIRDPFILPFKGKYYLYGSNYLLGFNVYISDDLENWSNPKTVFSYYDGFWGTKEYWAPEVHYYKNKFYMFASFKGDEIRRGTQILISDSPEGPFTAYSDGAITPKEWECLDGTLYIENDIPYMIFCHEWTQIKDGEMCVVQLSDDLKSTVGEVKVLFKASQPKWARKGAEHYVTDGPFLHRTKDGKLLMLWSSFGQNGYVEAVAVSENGSINDKWWHCDTLLNSTSGGHGMLFKDFEDNLKFVLHSPNWPKGEERAHIFDLRETPFEPYLEYIR